MLLIARRTGLVREIDNRLHLLKRHLPGHESDHALNIAISLLAEGRRLEEPEWRVPPGTARNREQGGACVQTLPECP